MSEGKAWGLSESLTDTAGALRDLDAFLAEQADGHRAAMEAVVQWLKASGRFEEEIRQSVAAIGGLFQKWSFETMFLLRLRDTMRFNELKTELSSVGQHGVLDRAKDLAGVGSRTLSARLKELEAWGLVRREAFPEVPVRVEYSLTPRGMRFGDLIMPAVAHLRLSGLPGGTWPEADGAP